MGGLESSLVVVVASCYLVGIQVAGQWGTNLHIFFICLQGSLDLKFAKEIANCIGSFHHEFEFTILEGWLYGFKVLRLNIRLIILHKC